MKAIIMAGGEGSRLRPLTCDLPKPMAPLLDRPVMAYALALLKRHGITDVGATLMYLPERIQSYFGDGSAFGAAMRYFVETAPLGTAGSMHLAADFLDETFAVLSGDGVTDCDLTAALAFHREKKALATLVLKRVENPLEYGVVIADGEGRVIRFVEKPGWGEVFSDTVNTGIYILEPQVLERIPRDRAFDFGRDLFPLLVERGEAVYAWTMSGYWCDIGDVAAYLKAHADAMDGRIDLPMNAMPGGVLRMPGARVDRGAVLEGPCFI
ncbi:MAG: NDP-sugar synthase, partial [Clostridia bacterium]|nr:NDP-sugar synthase [Clostridia bacterium]